MNCVAIIGHHRANMLLTRLQVSSGAGSAVLPGLFETPVFGDPQAGVAAPLVGGVLAPGAARGYLQHEVGAEMT